jgi:hypothetical protein
LGGFTRRQLTIRYCGRYGAHYIGRALSRVKRRHRETYWRITSRRQDAIQAQAQGRHIAALGPRYERADHFFSLAVQQLLHEDSCPVARALSLAGGIAGLPRLKRPATASPCRSL